MKAHVVAILGLLASVSASQGPALLKLARRAKGPATDPFIDPQGCRAYAADAARRLDRRVAEEQPKRP